MTDLARCPSHGIVVLPGAPCPACEAIRDGYPRGRGFVPEVTDPERTAEGGARPDEQSKP